MDCETIRRAWHHATDGGDSAEALRSHLARCEACRKYVADMERIVRAFDELRDETEFVASRKSADSGGNVRRRVSALLRMAAAIVLMVSVYTVFRWEGPTETAMLVEAPQSEPVSDLLEAPEPSRRRLGITLQGEFAQTMVAVALPSSEPNVQLYWLFPSNPGVSDSAGESP